MAEAAQKLLLLTGPTASGKTWAAVQAAGELPLEALSADSRQVYRGLDVGTAKPTAAEQAKLTHHLVDFLEAHETFSAGAFLGEAKKLVPQILERESLPVVVGGTGMYLRAFLQGYGFGQAEGDPVLRAQLIQRFKQEGGEVLHRELAAADPAWAQKIHPNDQLRVVRGLEILHLTGQGPSLQQREENRWLVKGVFLNPSKEELHRRIGERTERLLQEGWVQEVRRMLEAGVSASAPALQSIGYPEVVALVLGEMTEAECLRAILTRTRQYARKQVQLLRTFTQLTVVEHPEEAAERLVALGRTF